jgi:hypothetical protein
MGVGMENGFVDHLYTYLLPKVIIAPSLISTLCSSWLHTRTSVLFAVFTSRFLVTASYSGGSSAYVLMSLPAGCHLITAWTKSSLHRLPHIVTTAQLVSSLCSPWHGLCRNLHFQQFCHCAWASWCGKQFVSQLLPSYGFTLCVAPSFRLFIPNSQPAYHHFFFSKVCARDVCDQSHLFSPWPSSQ